MDVEGWQDRHGCLAFLAACVVIPAGWVLIAVLSSNGVGQIVLAFGLLFAFAGFVQARGRL